MVPTATGSVSLARLTRLAPTPQAASTSSETTRSEPAPASRFPVERSATNSATYTSNAPITIWRCLGVRIAKMSVILDRLPGEGITMAPYGTVSTVPQSTARLRAVDLAKTDNGP